MAEETIPAGQKRPKTTKRPGIATESYVPTILIKDPEKPITED